MKDTEELATWLNRLLYERNVKISELRKLDELVAIREKELERINTVIVVATKLLED